MKAIVRDEREMKDSGIDYLGIIPNDWNVASAKYFVKVSNGSDPTSEGDIPVYGSGKKSFRTCGEYKEGPAVLLGRKGTIDIPQYIKGRYWNVDTAFDVKNKEGYSLRYYYYLSTCFDYKRYSTQTALPSMTQSNYNDMRITIPVYSEQQIIANYLDDRCSKIDTIIAEAKASIEEYKELKQAVIYEAVTKGLDKNVEMKDSGVEWIGEIPATWNIERMKNQFVYNKGLNITKADLVDEGVAVISYGQIHAKNNTGTTLNHEFLRYISPDNIAINDKSLLNKGDIIFADTSEDYDGLGNAAYMDSNNETYAGYHTIIARPKKIDYSKYFAYLFKSDSWRKQLRERASGIKVFSVTQRMLNDVTLIIPEQGAISAIVSYLDKCCYEIENIISEKQSLIEDLESYKKSLIYEVVTGKRKVVE